MAHVRVPNFADDSAMDTSQTTTETPVEFEGSEEDHQVRRWRLEQFLRLGFDLASAVIMADAKIDLDVARRLVGAGCPVETASRILL
jgi:hypothetical protein